MALHFNKQLANVDDFMTKLEEQFGMDGVCSISYDTDTYDLDIVFASNVSLEYATAAINNYTYSSNSAPQYLCYTQVFPITRISQGDFTHAYSWVYNGKDLDRYVGVRLFMQGTGTARLIDTKNAVILAMTSFNLEEFGDVDVLYNAMNVQLTETSAIFQLAIASTSAVTTLNMLSFLSLSNTK